MKEIVEVVRLVPQARVQRMDAQIVEVFIPQLTEDVGEEIVDVLVPPAMFRGSTP